MKVYNELKYLSESVSKFVVGAEGNISKKQDGVVYIKSSGSSLKNLKETDIVSYDFSKKQLDNFTKKGSMELDFHIFLLSNDEINFVCHTHPVNTLKILCSDYAEEFASRRIFPDQVIFNDKKSCLIPYVTPGKELFEQIQKNVDKFKSEEKFFPKLILLKNHGIITCGKSINECVTITEICEKSAEIFLDCSKLNSLKFLTESEVDKLSKDENEKHRKNII